MSTTFADPTADPTFADLGVPSFIVSALADRGIDAPFAIQAATIADGLAGRDVCGRAPTGSGKTIAFGIPLIAHVADLGGKPVPNRPRALVLAPTRELAEQISTELASFAGRARIVSVYGGVGYGKQVGALKRGVDVLVACPGRLEDLISRGDVNLADVDHVVLDEADRMADMGFLPVVRRLLDQTANNRQTVLFSATLDGAIGKLSREYQDRPVRHEVGEETPDIRSATHRFWKVERTDRNQVVADVVKSAWPAVVFVRTKHGADRLARQLSKFGLETASIHGNRSQGQRQRALDEFSANQVHALVATDVAARGIHVDGVAAVIHYDPPADHKDYIHRSGRTARAGADGLVVSLVQPDQVGDVRKMIRKVELDGAEITRPDTDEVVDGIETPTLRPRPKQGGGGGGGGNNNNRNRSGGGKRKGPKHGGGNGRARNGSGTSRGNQNGGPKSGGAKNGGAKTGGNSRNGGGRSGGGRGGQSRSGRR